MTDTSLKNALQLEDKTLKGVESKDAGTTKAASLDQPAPLNALAPEADEEGVSIEFIHHFQSTDKDGALVDYVPGKTETLPAHLADQLVETKRAKYVQG